MIFELCCTIDVYRKLQATLTAYDLITLYINIVSVFQKSAVNNLDIRSIAYKLIAHIKGCGYSLSERKTVSVK